MQRFPRRVVPVGDMPQVWQRWRSVWRARVRKLMGQGMRGMTSCQVGNSMLQALARCHVAALKSSTVACSIAVILRHGFRFLAVAQTQYSIGVRSVAKSIVSERLFGNGCWYAALVIGWIAR